MHFHGKCSAIRNNVECQQRIVTTICVSTNRSFTSTIGRAIPKPQAQLLTNLSNERLARRPNEKPVSAVWQTSHPYQNVCVYVYLYVYTCDIYI
jgi:hypothetical protein